MKRFKEMSYEELDKFEYSYKLYQKNVNSMIDLLELEPVAFKKVFEKLFDENINSRKKFLKKE